VDISYKVLGYFIGFLNLAKVNKVQAIKLYRVTRQEPPSLVESKKYIEDLLRELR